MNLYVAVGLCSGGCPRWASPPPGTPSACLAEISLPALAVPRVLGIDDFALRRGSVYATVLIDAETGQRVDAVEGRTAGIAEKRLGDHRAPRS